MKIYIESANANDTDRNQSIYEADYNESAWQDCLADAGSPFDNYKDALKEFITKLNDEELNVDNTWFRLVVHNETEKDFIQIINL